MHILIATVQVAFTRGGAEILADELCAALRAAGHEVEIAAIPFKWYPADRIPAHVMACRLIDLTEAGGRRVDRLIGLKFPAYLAPHPNKVLWLLHQHRAAYDLWGQPLCDLMNFPDGAGVRDFIHNADRQLLPEARAIYTISGNVSARLRQHCEIESRPLYHPPRNAERFHCATAEPYLYFPSRLHPLKRQELVIHALQRCRSEVRVRFAGQPDTDALQRRLVHLAQSLRVNHRIDWLGAVSDEELVEGYARARGVVYPPVDEDYGYVTLEAMLSSKPVVTCTDSGGALEFVDADRTGLVAAPTPEALAVAMDELWEDPTRARHLGEAGRDSYASRRIGWTTVVEALTA